MDLAVDATARLAIVTASRAPYGDMAGEVVREPVGMALPRLLGEPAA